VKIIGTCKHYVPRGYGYREVDRKVGLCDCGEEVELLGFTNTCECGRDYNMEGQLLHHVHNGEKKLARVFLIF